MGGAAGEGRAVRASGKDGEGRNAFGIIREEHGETSRASDSLPGDKSFQNRYAGDKSKDMMFDSQIGPDNDEYTPSDDRRRLIDKNAPQSHNYHERNN